MDLQAEKESLKKMLDKIDDVQVIKAFKGYLNKNLEGENTIGYAADGTPLTQEEFEVEIDKAREAFEEGKYLTNEAMKSKSKNW